MHRPYTEALRVQVTVKDHPRLEYLMSCYYHQDWVHDVGSSDEKVLWGFYFDEEGLDRDWELERDIENLLLADEHAIHRTLSEYQSMGRLWKSPREARKWLEDLYVYVRSKNS